VHSSSLLLLVHGPMLTEPSVFVICLCCAEKADVWSLGVVFWEMLTLEVPFADMPPAQLIGGESGGLAGVRSTVLALLSLLCGAHAGRAQRL
jgi:serine/threonine protein kinase